MIGEKIEEFVITVLGVVVFGYGGYIHIIEPVVTLFEQGVQGEGGVTCIKPVYV